MKIELQNNIYGFEPFIKALIIESKAAELQTDTWPVEIAQPILEMQYMAQLKSYGLMFPDAENILILYDGIPVGWLLLNKGLSYHIVDIIITNNYRQIGIGTLVIKQIIRLAASENKKVTLNVSNNNRAQELYKRLGFIIRQNDGVFYEMTT